MYKRRHKSNSLGIVRTINSTQSKNIQSENSSPNRDIQKGFQSKTIPNKSTQNSLDAEESDEVTSDSEPVTKKSRKLGLESVSSSSLLGKELSLEKTEHLNKSIHLPRLDNVNDGSLEDNFDKDNSINLLNVCKTNSKINIKQRKMDKSELKSRVVATLDHRNNTSNTFSTSGSSGTFLEEICRENGLLLSAGGSPNTLKVDQAIFIREVTNIISQNNQDITKRVNQIITDLENYCINQKCFKFAVSLTETANECDISRGSNQDSMMRLLLQIDFLQSQVSQLLMDKLTKFVMDGTDYGGETLIITWVRLILHCFRFLDQMPNDNSVTERLLDLIFATSDISIQQEVVIALPDIITDEEHHRVALELTKLIRKNNPQLLASTLEALTNLSLQSDIKAQIQPMLMKAVQKMQPEFLPTVLKFLFTDCDLPLMDEIITFLRNELDLTEIQGDTASIQVLVFSALRDALLSSRSLSNVWQRNISAVKGCTEHKPIDIIMLFVLLSSSNDPVRQRSVEALFRNKVRAEMFTENLVNETMKFYIAVVKEYFQIATKIAGVLLKSTEPLIIDFASKMYIGMFVNMDGLWCKWVLSELQVCVGAGDKNVVRAALSILQHLTNNFHHRVKPLGVILMLLLNKLNDLDLSEVCQLMDVLCHIAYIDDTNTSCDCSILQDEINILIQKQLASSQLNVLRSGVVGCVMAIKYIAKVSEDNSDSNISEDSEKGNKAIQLLEILLSSTRSSLEIQGLALDQLSHLLISSVLEPSFVNKLSSLMKDDLQDSFLISASDFVPNNNDIRCSLQFYLDDESEQAIALNLCELVNKESEIFLSKPMMGVSCLHPLLRLLRGLEMKDLSEIDALLGCAINMPQPSIYTEFSQLTTYNQHIALHCLFHCINWFHEIVNCFAYLVKKNEAKKVLSRLRTIVWMRDILAHCLPLAMEYTPPICYFQSLTKPKISGTSDKLPKRGKPKKKLKKNKNKGQENEESNLACIENTSHVEDEDTEETCEGKMADLSQYKHYFRELDIDVWLIFTQPLIISPTPVTAECITPELGPRELLFLLDDCVVKLVHILTSSNKRVSFLKTNNIQSIGFENLEKFPVVRIVKNTIKLIPSICSFLEKTAEYTKNLINVNDGILDSTGMFIDGSVEIKQCQGKLFKIFAILFSWIGFQNQANSTLLLAGLSNVASRVNGQQTKNKSKKLLVRECVQYLAQYKDHIVDLVSACTLVDALIALSNHAHDDISLHCMIASISMDMLGRRWYDFKGNLEKGAVLNGRVSFLLNYYISYSADQLAVVTSCFSWLSSECEQLSDKDTSLSTFPVISKSNLYILIGGLIKGLEGAIKQKLDKPLKDQEQLELWSSFTQGLETLVTIIKAHDNKQNLRIFMKGCTNVLKLFLANGMSTCTFMFKHEPALVSQILKKLQITTRYIQTICNYVKVSKDTSLTQFLPSLRAVMESILLRVKSIIVLNNCADAFFMGSMKNRDLKGQEIPSQEIHLDDDEDEQSFKNKTDSEPEEENENPNESDLEENEETGDSVSILF